VSPESTEQLKRELATEREQLAEALDDLRGELGVTAKLRPKLPLFAAGAASAGFVLAGGVGASLRYLARRGREK